MAYFTAVLARAGAQWRARDVEVDDVADLDDLTDQLRAVGVGDQPVLAVIEHEDAWFALVRVDGEDDPRLFVSDLDAATHSHYAALLAPAADVAVAADLTGDLAGEEPAPPAEPEGDAAVQGGEAATAAWAGETDLLEDLGVSGGTLRKLVEENSDDPGAVLGEVAQSVGFVELLDTLR